MCIDEICSWGILIRMSNIDPWLLVALVDLKGKRTIRFKLFNQHSLKAVEKMPYQKEGLYCNFQSWDAFTKEDRCRFFLAHYVALPKGPKTCSPRIHQISIVLLDICQCWYSWTHCNPWIPKNTRRASKTIPFYLKQDQGKHKVNLL